MYKIFLCIRYLTRKGIVIFPILSVSLCVMMLIITSSIMGGFVDHVISTNQGLMGDVVVESQSMSGFPYYEELEGQLRKLPEVESTTHVIQTFALFNLPGRGNAGVQVMGIDPVGKSHVSRFRESLFRQYKAPMEAVDALSYAQHGSEAGTWRAWLEGPGLEWMIATAFVLFALLWIIGLIAHAAVLRWLAGAMLLAGLLLMIPTFFRKPTSALPATGAELQKRAWDAYSAADSAEQKLEHEYDVAMLANVTDAKTVTDAKQDRLRDALHLARLDTEKAWRIKTYAEELPNDRIFNSRDELIHALVPPEPTFTPPAESQERYPGETLPKDGCIVGVDLGLFSRDRRGNYLRSPADEYLHAIITCAPLTPRGDLSRVAPQAGDFLIVDDSNTEVFEADSLTVYAPFEAVQKLAMMQAMPLDEEHGGGMRPARCTQVQIKLKTGVPLDDGQTAIEKAFDVFAKTHTDLPVSVTVQTWEKKQAKYIGAVTNEKHMITVILGIMSMVVVVVVFLIFYMIVRDKTRDIGIVKAIGGSGAGVAAIFMMYGLFVGAVGGLLGVLGGVSFVVHTNQIHEWLYRTTGIVVWDRSVYMFDKIPDQVNPNEVAIIFGMAVLAGFLGAVLPAIFAGRKDPVAALRYE